MKTMTLRNIPDKVAEYIANRASAEGRSINMMTVALLSEAAGIDCKPKKFRDLSWIKGSWDYNERRSFEKTTSECRRIDPEDWK